MLKLDKFLFLMEKLGEVVIGRLLLFLLVVVLLGGVVVGGELQVWRNKTSGANVSWVDYDGDWFMEGFVGVGNSLPGSARLNVSGSVDAWQLMINGTAVSTGGGAHDPSSVAFTNQSETFDGNVSFVDSVNVSEDLEVGGLFFVDGVGGNVGVGVLSPLFKLDVYGVVNTTSVLINATGCSNGLVTDAGGLVYCSPSSFVFDDVSVNATHSNDNSSVWSNLSSVSSLLTGQSDTHVNDNATVWANLSDISSVFSSYFVFTGLGSELNNDLGWIGSWADSSAVENCTVGTEVLLQDGSCLDTSTLGGGGDAHDPANVAFTNQSEVFD